MTDHLVFLTERERQRVEHVVLGLPRRPPAPHKRPHGLSSRQWKALRATLPKPTSTLAPGIEEAVALREIFGGSKGTPETIARAARIQQGALARLYRSGALSANQLAAAEEIRATVEAIRTDVALPIASWETRVDAGYRVDLAGRESLFSIVLQAAYTRWRGSVDGPVAMLLDVIVDDWPYTEAAARHRVGDKRAKTLLINALDYWWRCRAALRKGG